MDQAAESGLILGLAATLRNAVSGALDAQAVASAKNRLFHAFGVSLANSRLPAAEVAWNTIQDRTGACHVFGRDKQVGAQDAAFVNAVIGHGSLLEDCGPGGLREGSHPGTFIIPAALAVAEVTGASGGLFLAGVIAGYEAVSRIGAASPASIVRRRFRPVGVMGAFGAAAACATIFGADEEQMAAALAIAANLAGGSTQGIFEGTMEPYFQSGFGARNGIFAARLGMAKAATSRDAFEGAYGFFQTYGGEPGDAEILLAPRAQAGISAVGTKRFAACLQNQQTLAVIVDGLAAPLALDDIEHVVIRRPETGTNGLNSPGVSSNLPFPNMLSAQMSARFTAAAALLGHPVDDPNFFHQNHANSEICALTRRIDLQPLQEELLSVTVQLRNGEVILLDADKSKVLFPGDAEFRQAFVKRAGKVLGQRTAAAMAAIEDLENLTNLSALVAFLWPATAQS